MKKVILVLLMVHEIAYAQISIDFESGEATGWIQSVEGRWIADSYGALAGSFSLHHIFDNPEAGYDAVATEVKNMHPDEGTTTWSFLLQHGYEPSSQNNWLVFLMSESGPENMSVSSCTGAYVIGVNINSSDDTLRLMKIGNGNKTQVVNCRINWQIDVGSDQPARISISRSSAGDWEVSVSRPSGELIRSSTGIDEGFFLPYFGVGYRYSATKDRLLWIDDITIDGVFYSDTTPPSITRYNIIDRKSLEMELSEEPAGALITANFILNDEIAASSVQQLSPLKFVISFPSEFVNKQTNSVSVIDVCDKSGNCDERLTIKFLLAWAATGDIAITEIMADPAPVVSLPESEYLEITNRTEYSYDLSGWILTAGEQHYKFPGITIGPREIIILCDDSDMELFASYGKVAAFTSFPSLNDDGKLIYITDNTGALISGVDYTPEWYYNELKSEGGWSLEIIDQDYPFFGTGNWKASVSTSGGTPGKKNSVAKPNPDISFNGIVNVFPADSLHLKISFSESLKFDQDLQFDLKTGNSNVLNISPADPLFREFVVTLGKPLKIRTSYLLEISGSLEDFAGNLMENKSFTFGLPEKIGPGDIVFNELLFNPIKGGADFIEFLNVSDKTADISRLYLVSVDELGDTSTLVSVADKPGCFLPSSYYVITTDREQTMIAFPGGDGERIFEVGRLPSMPDDHGHLLLLNRELDVIDEVDYDDKMHYSLLSDKEGVSLGKISPELPSGERSSWSSATKNSGWGTPGRENSVYSNFPESVHPDTTPPLIAWYKIIDRKSLELELSEEPAPGLTSSNFMLNDEIAASSVQHSGPMKLTISFPSEFRNRQTNLMSILDVCDTTGNCSEKLIIEFSPVWAMTGDVVITEIMADPAPVVSLPESEYLEIFNGTEYLYSLKGWILTAGGQHYKFPDITIGPGEIIILCDDSDMDLFAPYGKVAGFSSFPVLNDDGKLIYISDDAGVLISGVEYTPEWYNNELKSEGGWSLEIIDQDYPFFGTGNWKASVSNSGGTPGTQNSVARKNPDISFGGIINVFPTDSLHLKISFSEPLRFDQDLLLNLKIENNKVLYLSPADPLFREYVVTLGEPLKNRQSYLLEVSGLLEDFAGNLIENKNFTFGLPEKIRPGDIVFNEILFNPIKSGADFIEFLNVSEKTADISRLYLVSVDELGDTSSLVSVSDIPGCFFPSTYYVITTDREQTMSSFPGGDSERIFEVGKLPSMPDNRGHLVLLNRELDVIDEVYYDDKMHYSLLSGTEGVSLEKISPALPSGERSNWHSASENAGWGTPGRENSVYSNFPDSEGQVTLSTSRITPDSDGLDDYLRIGLNFPGAGNVVSASVFDESGSLVRKIAVNLLCSPETMLYWDGTANDGTPVRTGIYIILINYYNDTGKTGHWKKVCTVIR